jgi:hypothetical protein
MQVITAFLSWQSQQLAYPYGQEHMKSQYPLIPADMAFSPLWKLDCGRLYPLLKRLGEKIEK